MPTVAEICAEGLPAGSVVRAGAAHLSRDVTWATTVRLKGPGVAVLRGGELALVSLTGLPSATNERVDRALERLAEAGVAAVGFVGPCDAAAEEAAARAGMPLIELPAGLSLRDVEAAVNRFLTERRYDAHNAAHRLHADLTRLALDGASLDAILGRLRDLTSRPCLIADARLRPRADATCGLVNGLARASSVVSDWSRAVGRIPAEPPVHTIALGESGGALLVSPLVHGGRLGGVLALWATDVPREADVLAVSRGASACAIALARERAAIDAADQLRLELLAEIRAGGTPDAAIVERAARLGHALDRLHVPLAVDAADVGVVTSALARVAPESRALVSGGDDAVLLLVPLPEGGGGGSVADVRMRSLAEELSRELGRGAGSPCVGVGHAGASPAAFRVGLAEAEQALSLGRRMPGRGGAVHIADLGIHRLLAPLVGTDALEGFRVVQLGALEAYDGENNTDLVGTLRAYYAARGSPTLTARALHLHRNSLMYRLQRIRDVTGTDPDEPETRLSLEVALRVRDLLDLRP
ncbi:MAG: helix-turn-helix domain-containing protein [Chloroflexota bacterium]